MTGQKHLKQLIRTRMQKTGERYATARRNIVRHADPAPSDPTARWHMPGNVPATTALRMILAHAGVRAPHTGQPFSEAMLFGIAGGIGVGVFSFYYEREDVATFFLAGRHQWHDDLAYLNEALARLGITAALQESTGAKVAARQLDEMLGSYGPCVAWVDMATLPHRAMPASWSGGGYHVVTVYRVDSQSGTALIGDLTDDPIEIKLDDLARARARIKKQRQRLLAIPPSPSPTDLAALVRGGLMACHAGLLQPSLRMAPANARLDALRTWAERMVSTTAKERWARVYRPGPNLWRGLCSIYDFIEHYGTGGGLCRPLFADFLGEAAEALRHPPLAELAERYAELGRGWAELANAALPDDLALFHEAKKLHAHKAELLHSGAPAEEIRAIWQQLDALEQQAREHFPLSDGDYAELRAQLRTRIEALYEGEVAAHEAIVRAFPVSG
jgi:hypothetical protein